MDLYDLFAGSESFHVRRLLEHAGALTPDQLDAPLHTQARVFPWDTPSRSLRDLLRRLVQTKEVWTAALTGGSLPNLDAEAAEQGTPEALLGRLEKVDVEFNRILSDVRRRNAWGDTFVDALCEPPETFTFGGMFAHVITFNTYQRLLALDALRRLGVKVEGVGCPSEYEASLAPAKA
jgi:AraC family transcriptional regulator